MMFSSIGSSAGRGVQGSATVQRRYTRNNVTTHKSGRIPHRLRLDDERVAYSFCPLYSIPEDEPVCGYRQIVRDEPFVECRPVTPPYDADAVLQENTTAARNTGVLDSVHVPRVPMESNLESGKAQETTQADTETVVVTVPESHEPSCPQAQGTKRAPRHLEQLDGFLQALQGMSMLQ